MASEYRRFQEALEKGFLRGVFCFSDAIGHGESQWIDFWLVRVKQACESICVAVLGAPYNPSFGLHTTDQMGIWAHLGLLSKNRNVTCRLELYGLGVISVYQGQSVILTLSCCTGAFLLACKP